jgi:hypothetical protein
MEGSGSVQIMTESESGSSKTYNTGVQVVMVLFLCTGISLMSLVNVLMINIKYTRMLLLCAVISL